MDNVKTNVQMFFVLLIILVWMDGVYVQEAVQAIMIVNHLIFVMMENALIDALSLTALHHLNVWMETVLEIVEQEDAKAIVIALKIKCVLLLIELA